MLKISISMGALSILMVAILSSNAFGSDLLNALDEVGPVVFLNMLYRHGDRTPIEFYPTDPYKDRKYWPEGLGQLTKEGKLRHYNLGKWIRERYSTLIPSGKYSSDVIYIRSTDMDRTLMSALSNLAGMFPPSKEDQFGPIEWEPVPVYTVPEHLDKILRIGFPCEKYAAEYKKVLKTNLEIQKINRELADVYSYVSEQAGKPYSSVNQIETLYSLLAIEEAKNLTLPGWTKAVYPHRIKPCAGFSFSVPTLTPLLKRLKGGPLLKEMVGHMKGKRDGTLKPDRNMWVYSAHDTTVANFLNTIGVFTPHSPPFSALVLVELRKNANEEYFVSVLYKTCIEEPAVMVIPGCSAACPLEKFEELLKEVIPEDWDAECRLDSL